MLRGLDVGGGLRRLEGGGGVMRLEMPKWNQNGNQLDAKARARAHVSQQGPR